MSMEIRSMDCECVRAAEGFTDMQPSLTEEANQNQTFSVSNVSVWKSRCHLKKKKKSHLQSAT